MLYQPKSQAPLAMSLPSLFATAMLQCSNNFRADKYNKKNVFCVCREGASGQVWHMSPDVENIVHNAEEDLHEFAGFNKDVSCFTYDMTGTTVQSAHDKLSYLYNSSLGDVQQLIDPTMHLHTGLKLIA